MQTAATDGRSFDQTRAKVATGLGVVGLGAGAAALASWAQPVPILIGSGLLVLACLALMVTPRRRHADRPSSARLGPYVIEDRIGAGGMGEVYLARHELLQRPTAVKMLPPHKAGAPTIARFEREVRLTSSLSHPNTVSIYDFGRTPEGVFYYAMEYLDGVDLEALVALEGPQQPGRVVHILQQVCGSLAEAHDHGLVHRDIKPANIVLCNRGGVPDVAKVVDFGLVKDVASADPGLSGVNAILGTPLYLTPEAITCDGELDGRSDIYALGAVAYYLLTGKPVFEGSSIVEICGKHLNATPVPPSDRINRDLPPDLEELVLRCLAKRREDRPATAAALREALLACVVEPWTEDQARSSRSSSVAHAA